MSRAYTSKILAQHRRKQRGHARGWKAKRVPYDTSRYRNTICRGGGEGRVGGGRGAYRAAKNAVDTANRIVDIQNISRNIDIHR